MYDKVKYRLMPYAEHKYKGINYVWRVVASGSICMGMTALLTYPFDLIHTRVSSDLTKKG
jgi:hypothetical protein